MASLALSLASCGGSSRPYAEIQSSGVLRIATNYSASGAVRDGDTVSGPQYGLASSFCQSIGLRPEVVLKNDISQCLDLLHSGAVDLVACQVPVTKDLRKKFAFSHPLGLDRQVLVQRRPGSLVVRRSSGDTVRAAFISSQLQMAEHVITLPKDSPYAMRLHNLSQEIGDTIRFREMPGYSAENLAVLVADGEIDYTVCNLQLVKSLQAKYPQLDFSTPVSFSQILSWAVAPDQDSLLCLLNKWIDGNIVR